MKRIVIALALLVSWGIVGLTQAQMPAAAPEHAVLKKDVGTWDVQMKMWMGPDGKADPTASPMETKGVEVNRMLGEFWVISEFKADFGGMPFEGHGTFGFNPASKKFEGSWVDVMSPAPMHMVGTYDERTRTMTSQTKGIGPDGKETKGKSTVVYEGDNKRVMTMYELKAGTENEWLKSMEMTYTKRAESGKK